MQGFVLVKHLVIWIFLFTLLASCKSAKRDVVPDVDELPPTVQGVLATIVQATATPFPVMVMVTQSIVEPTAVSMATETIPAAMQVEAASGIPSVGFSGLRFALAADGAVQNVFPAQTTEVYALWEYRGMSPTENIRRIWFRDDQIWLTREEKWNWGEYGSEGTMRDVSVYDDEGSGLQPATYRLQLYVNDQLQEEAAFIVLMP